ncbi:15075_t:CDS:2, partial [Cetraspora pellucida]
LIVYFSKNNNTKPSGFSIYMTNKRPQLNIKLISLSAIIHHLHYGIDICNWWTTWDKKDLKKRVYLYLIHVGWQTVLEINNKNFYTQVLESNKKHEYYPSYRCQVGLKFRDIEEAPSSTITSLYERVCQNNNTNFSGPQVLVEAEVGYTAMFTGEHLGKRAIYIQQIDLDGCYIKIYQDGISKYHYTGITPNEVWKASKKLKKFHKTELFGLEHLLTHQVLSAQQISKCDETYWHNKNIMNHLYNYFLHHYTISNIQWHKFFIDWKNSSSTIIEFHNSLELLYP